MRLHSSGKEKTSILEFFFHSQEFHSSSEFEQVFRRSGLSLNQSSIKSSKKSADYFWLMGIVYKWLVKVTIFTYKRSDL